MSDEFNYIKENLIKGIIVFSFIAKGKCPNCHRDLIKNEFKNWECHYCMDQALYNGRSYLRYLYKRWGIESVI